LADAVDGAKAATLREAAAANTIVSLRSMVVLLDLRWLRGLQLLSVAVSPLGNQSRRFETWFEKTPFGLRIFF
jgi:hypothetical protein